MVDVARPQVPTYDRLMFPTLNALKALGASATNQEIDTKVIELMALTDAQVNVPHGKGRSTEVSYRLYWARTYLKAFGAIEQSARGVWTITDLGARLSPNDVGSIPRAVKARYRSGVQKGRVRDVVVPEVAVDAPVGANDVWRDEGWKEALLDELLGIPPSGFERLCQRVLRESGFTKVEVTGRSGDGGIDGVGVLQVALLSFPVLFQCKRYEGAVGPAAIRDFRGAMAGRTDKGIFITTGNFSKEATREATRDGAPPIDLVDGYRLCDLLKQYGLGVTIRMVEEVSLDTGWFSQM